MNLRPEMITDQCRKNTLKAAQAAFYLSSDDCATFFEFVGIQKVAPYKLFRLKFHKDDEFLSYGRKKMNFLLQKAKEEADKPNRWRPSAWNREEIL